MENSVKTAFSIKKALFDQVEEMARQQKISRSSLIALALENYIQQRQNQILLEQINEAYADMPDEEDKARLKRIRKHHRKLVEGTW